MSICAISNFFTFAGATTGWREWIFYFLFWKLLDFGILGFSDFLVGLGAQKAKEEK